MNQKRSPSREKLEEEVRHLSHQGGKLKPPEHPGKMLLYLDNSERMELLLSLSNSSNLILQGIKSKLLQQIAKEVITHERESQKAMG